MATTLKLAQCDDVEKTQRESRDVLIGLRVILALGEPSNLFRVQVRELWDRRYRVNVYVGPDAASARVANSYFLETDVDGNVVASTPKIKRLYDCAAAGPSPSPSTGSAGGG
jgi:hypothetical protein